MYCGIVGKTAKGGTGGGDFVGGSPELQSIIDAWPRLSGDVKASLLAIVAASVKQRSPRGERRHRSAPIGVLNSTTFSVPKGGRARIDTFDVM